MARALKREAMPRRSEAMKGQEWRWQYKDQHCNGMERRCEELLWHCTVTAGMAVARHRGEPLRLRCDKESEGYARTCKRHCPQGNETDATEKYSPALAKRGAERHWLGLAMIGRAEAWTCKDCYGTA